MHLHCFRLSDSQRCVLGSPNAGMQGVQISHAEFRYPDGRPGSRASEAYTSLTSGRRGFDCNGHGMACTRLYLLCCKG